jgi:hypothetical protein
MKQRKANNKNIQTMEQNINISEILKDKPVGLKFYSNTFGYISFNGVHKDKVYFFSEDTNAHSVKPNGKMYDGGECIIFPSKEMRDWEKFSWKKGDVLVSKDREVYIIFEKFEDDAFTKFRGKYYLWNECYNEEVFQMETSVFEKASDDDAQTYINNINKCFGGKLNRETLEIEKAQPDFKDGDIVMSDSGTIVLVRGISLTRKIYYHAYMCDEYIYINQVEGEFFSRISRIKRFATDSEKQQLFDALEKEGKRWDSEKKQIVDLKPAFEVGKLYVFNEDDEDGELTIIGKLIDKNESEDTLTFGNQYEIETEKFVTDQAFDLRISVNKELREATENEVELFNKHYAIWKKEKEARKQPAFKTFDKVLVRCGKGFKWLPAFFIRDRGEDFAARYNVLPLHSGKPADFFSCIPFEGHENIAFTSYDIEDLPF